MSVDKVKSFGADKLLTMLFDDGVYTELTPMTGDVLSVVTACGKVQGQNVYAFAQNVDALGGAMTASQAEKLKRLYALALKTGYPVVGFYAGSTAKVAQGNMLLDSLGGLVASAGRLSGVVPQISVVTGDVVSGMAILANSADFVVMTNDAKLAMSADSECKGKGKAALCVEDVAEAVDAVINLISYLPANNLSSAPVSNQIIPASDSVFDKDTELVLFENTGDGAKVSFARLQGQAVGSVVTLGKALDCKTSKKIAKFVSICDAFSIPVITQVDAEEFECLSGATAVLSAYTEATTIKISVVTGKATGPVYMALAGSAGRMDAVLAMTCAVISPVKPEAAAYIALGDNLTGTVAEQDAQISQYIATELGAENAAKAGYIDDIADDTTLRTKLINYLDILSSKRESSLPKKHSTI
ncbi:MAG: hypothetical protein E7563_02750 [Ruminococcaceae bacterium]|nr:hypothetical protein [Oscillospiraceae bacterium]